MSEPVLSSFDFFRQMHGLYEQLIERFKGRSMLLDAVLQLAWGSFDSNVTVQCEGLPELDCHKGCATCCTLRVTATAPEVFMLARFIRAVSPGLARHGIDLREQLAQANGVTCGHGERDREIVGWIEYLVRAAEVSPVVGQCFVVDAVEDGRLLLRWEQSQLVFQGKLRHQAIR